ncbi:MAG: 2'-5' RNA ligase family protein, partial [Cyanobacteria bacterium]|nr:2'-5' RNA ligase family protein [Cyanobacteria bacterium GSL.Bin21]
YQFTVQALTLLLHNGKHWEIEDSFALAEGVTAEQ